MPERVPPRSKVPERYTWDIASVFSNDEAWEAEMDRVKAMLPILAEFQGRLAQEAGVLAEWLAGQENLLRSLGKIYVYAYAYHEVDTADQKAAGRYDRAMGIYARCMATIAFGEPEMLAIGIPTLKQWVQSEPRLAIYAHYVDSLERRQAHVRSAEVEQLLGEVGEPFAIATEIHGILADADLTFRPARTTRGEELQLTQGNIDALITHADRQVRRTAFENYADAHLTYKNTMANCLSAGVKQNVFMARTRRYGSALEAAVTANFIPTAVFHNVVDVFKRNLPIWHRYWRLRRQALGVDALHEYDIKAPLTTTSPTVSYEQSVDWICAGMCPLGEEYVRAMRRGLLEERWVDVYPNIGKRAGAFSSGMPGTHPFVLMSYTDDLYSLSTLAHELGHSLHSYHSWSTQPLIYANYSIFVAEVASNFNQALVREHLFQANPDPNFQIALIEEALSNFHRYFFIMPTLARFELEIHQRVERGEALTADTMSDLMADLFAEGYGGEVAMDRERTGITWAEFPSHLYMNFYVYQYTTGIAAAQALAQRVRDGQPGAAERYLEFLRAGSSLYPLDALKLAGIDMTTPEPVQQAFDYMGGVVDRLESLLAQRK
ncbi:MAG: oligoendopeptidase F [Anaerolineae bacterium]